MEVNRSFPMYAACNLNYLGMSIFLVSVAGQLPNIIMYHNIIKITVSYETKVQMRIRRTTSLPMKLNRDEPRASSSPSQRQRCQKPRAASANFYPIIFYPKTKKILTIHLFSIPPSRNKEKKSRVFCLHSITSTLRQRMVISFSNIYVPEFLLFLLITLNEAKESFISFLEDFQSKYFLSDFFYFIWFPSFQGQIIQNQFSWSIQNVNYKAAVKDKAVIGYHLAIMDKLNKKRFPQDVN